ncbi:MAG TPA: hypothetical protein VMV86_02800 [Methanosarcinales archaeon]|nr:hypothetical protein [Methanosarcinales archaeon]
MTDKLFIPNMPSSPMFIEDEDKTMTIEWQEFFRALYERVGGLDGPNSTDILLSDVGDIFSVPTSYTKRIDELERKISMLSEPKSYDKRIDELEKLIQTLTKPTTIPQNIIEYIQPSYEGQKLYEVQVTVPPAKARSAGVGIPPVSALFGNRIGREYDIGDKEYFELELPYGIFLGRPIEIELHWFIDEANDDPGGANEEQVQWRASYTLTKEDGTEAVDAVSTDLDSGDIAIPGTAKFLVQTSCGYITSGLFELHDNLGLCIERIAVTKDDPTANPILLTVEIEYYSKYPGIPK